MKVGRTPPPSHSRATTTSPWCLSLGLESFVTVVRARQHDPRTKANEGQVGSDFVYRRRSRPVKLIQRGPASKFITLSETYDLTRRIEYDLDAAVILLRKNFVSIGGLRQRYAVCDDE